MPPLPHLHLRNLSREAIPFRPYSGGSKREPRDIPDRQSHGASLRANLVAIGDRLDEHAREQAKAGIPKNKQGLVITARGFDTQDLWLGEMKATSPGLSLLSVVPPTEASPAAARLFVGRASLQTMVEQVESYASYGSRDSADPDRKRARFKLFESTSELRVAALEDVWMGPLNELPGKRRVQVETWIRSDRSDYFYRMIENLRVSTVGNPTGFADSLVIDMELNAAQMSALLLTTGAVIEFRPSSHFVTEYRRADPDGRKAIAEAVAQRVVAAADGAPRTVILDSGVDAGNPLLRHSLPSSARKTVDEDWGTDDDSGHGTAMAGVALFPDLEGASSSRGPIVLSTALESVKIVRPLNSTNLVVPRDAIQEAVRRVERDASGGRVYSLSATVPGEEENGRQSATSAAIDKLAWNGGERSRLFCVAAGNVPATASQPYEVSHYTTRNSKFPVQSPAQAVNALSVGAFTDKDLGRGRLVAPKGDLCPVSRTSQSWDNRLRTSNKPDVVYEGGNHVVDPGGRTSRGSGDTRVLTTGRVSCGHLDLTGETSAATAGVSGMATRVLARYPHMRAESIRALVVNCASWTDAMREQADRGQDAKKQVLERFGWGVPDERSAMESAKDSLTLVIEDELKPFETRGTSVALKEMKYFQLPWPRRELARMGNSDVTLVCTLSYFIEPDPLADKRARKDRYASHRLRFRLNQPGDTGAAAQSRLNQLVEAEDDELEMPSGEGGRWLVDWRRCDIGTIHNNIWTGPAHELAVRGGVCVYPVKGWWAERRSPEYRRSTPFSLVISIRAAQAGVDLYTEAMAAVPAHANIVAAAV